MPIMWPYSSGWGLTSSAYNKGVPTEADAYACGMHVAVVLSPNRLAT